MKNGKEKETNIKCAPLKSLQTTVIITQGGHKIFPCLQNIIKT